LWLSLFFQEVSSVFQSFLPEKGEQKASSQATSVFAESPCSLASVVSSLGLPTPKDRVGVIDKSGNHIVRHDWYDA
jgi:hypothetical protein